VEVRDKAPEKRSPRSRTVFRFFVIRQPRTSPILHVFLYFHRRRGRRPGRKGLVCPRRKVDQYIHFRVPTLVHSSRVATVANL